MVEIITLNSEDGTKHASQCKQMSSHNRKGNSEFRQILKCFVNMASHQICNLSPALWFSDYEQMIWDYSFTVSNMAVLWPSVITSITATTIVVIIGVLYRSGVINY